MKKFDTLTFSASDTNETISKKIADRVKEVSLKEITEELSKEFVFQEDAIKSLYAGCATNKNIILFGPGGFSKSVITKAFLEFYGIPTHYKIGHSESTTEDLLGIPNISKLINENKLETAFENSMFSKPGMN